MDQVSPPLLVPDETGWIPKLKHYPHFDSPISMSDVIALVKSPQAVTANTYYPFMRYDQSWQPYRGSNSPKASKRAKARAMQKPEKKTRPIRFASRRDAYIFSYYRYLLQAPYEKLLADAGLDESVIAYRRIRQPNGSGKSNIEFAREAFDRIRTLGNCAAIALDISSFFESLDHALLNEKWARVLGDDTLPPDHASVFKAITRYAVIDREEVYERLGFLKEETRHGKARLTFTTKFEDMPRKLCGNRDFREKICGQGNKHKSLVNLNRKPYGIPQGSPISDMLANIYLIDFDIVLKEYCASRGGFYFRYSDDIMMIVPGGDKEALEACQFAKSEIGNHGDKLKIKDKKTSAIVYEQIGDEQSFRLVAGELGRNGLEYLGFRYDGKNVWIRDATISKLYRKVSGSIKAECVALIKRYPGKDADFVFSKFKAGAFFQRYGRVEDFDPRSDYSSWTFWTYARKAIEALGEHGAPIPGQLRNYKKIVRRRVEREIRRRLG